MNDRGWDPGGARRSASSRLPAPAGRTAGRLTRLAAAISARQLADLDALMADVQRAVALTLRTLKESYIKARDARLALALRSSPFCFDGGPGGVRVVVGAYVKNLGRQRPFRELNHQERRIAPAIGRCYGAADRAKVWETVQLPTALESSMSPRRARGASGRDGTVLSTMGAACGMCEAGQIGGRKSRRSG